MTTTPRRATVTQRNDASRSAGTRSARFMQSVDYRTRPVAHAHHGDSVVLAEQPRGYIPPYYSRTSFSGFAVYIAPIRQTPPPRNASPRLTKLAANIPYRCCWRGWSTMPACAAWPHSRRTGSTTRLHDTVYRPLVLDRCHGNAYI